MKCLLVLRKYLYPSKAKLKQLGGKFKYFLNFNL